MLIRDVIPANTTDRKKITEKTCPMGIWEKIFGIVINIKAGPEPGSMPKANTAGIIARAERRAAMVSNTAVRMEAPIISAFLFK